MTLSRAYHTLPDRFKFLWIPPQKPLQFIRHEGCLPDLMASKLVARCLRISIARTMALELLLHLFLLNIPSNAQRPDFDFSITDLVHKLARLSYTPGPGDTRHDALVLITSDGVRYNRVNALLKSYGRLT